MTQLIQTTPKAPAPQAPSTLMLGEVTFQGRTYLAILHYQGEDGTAIPITKNMESAKEVYCKALQQMLTEAEKHKLPKALLERVSIGGFVFTTSQEEDELYNPSHQMLKTQEAWNRFLFLLNNPELAPSAGNYLELIDTSDIPPEERPKMIDQIAQKLQSAYKEGSGKVELTPEEAKLLWILGFNKMSQGIIDPKEYATLTSCYHVMNQKDLSLFDE